MMAMDYDDMKNYFLATMEQFQQHQAELGRLKTSLDAAVEAMIQTNPGFAALYQETLNLAPKNTESERLIERLEVAIRGLKESE